MNRRTFLSGSALTVLSACTGAKPVTPVTVLTDVQALVSGLSGAVQQIEAADPSLIPLTVQQQIATYLGNAEAAAAQLSADMAASTSASWVRTVETDVNAVLNVLSGPPVNGLIPAPFNQALAAAAIVVPILEAFTAQYLPATTASTKGQRFAALAPGMTTAQAVGVLQRFSAQ